MPRRSVVSGRRTNSTPFIGFTTGLVAMVLVWAISTTFFSGHGLGDAPRQIDRVYTQF